MVVYIILVRDLTTSYLTNPKGHFMTSLVLQTQRVFTQEFRIFSNNTIFVIQMYLMPSLAKGVQV